MDNESTLKLLERSRQINNECREFIKACEEHLERSKKHCDATAYLIEERMVRIEETIANKAEAVAILRLLGKPHDLTTHISIREESELVHGMLEVVKQIPVSNQSSGVQNLRNQLDNLTFLPFAKQ